MPAPRTRARPDDAPANEQSEEEWRLRVAAAVDEESEEIEETSEDRVSIMLRDVNESQRAKVRLYRRNSNDKKLAWCADYTPDQFETGGFDMIRQQWGPGAYEVRVYGENAAGKFAVRGRTEIEIVAGLTPAAAPAQSSELAQVLARMSEQQAAQNAAILQALQNKPDPISGLRETFSLMSMMREAMGMNNQPVAQQKSSIGEIIEAIKELKGAQELIAPEKPEVDPDNPMTMLPQILELVKMATQKPQAPENAPFPLLRPPTNLSQVSVMLPPNHPSSAPPTTPQPTEETVQADYIKALRESFDKLIAIALQYAAATDDNARQEFALDGADAVYEELPDELVPVLRGDNWFGALQMVVPEIAAYEQFFTRVRDAALLIFDEAARQETIESQQANKGAAQGEQNGIGSFPS